MSFESRINIACMIVLWLCCIYQQMDRITAAEQSQEVNGFGKYHFLSILSCHPYCLSFHIY